MSSRCSTHLKRALSPPKLRGSAHAAADITDADPLVSHGLRSEALRQFQRPKPKYPNFSANDVAKLQHRVRVIYDVPARCSTHLKRALAPPKLREPFPATADITASAALVPNGLRADLLRLLRRLNPTYPNSRSAAGAELQHRIPYLTTFPLDVVRI